MCERAILAVLTFPRLVYIRGTELGLILVWMIEFFNPVVSLLASIALGAISVLGNIVADLRLIGTQGSPLVLLLVMIVRTPLEIVAV